MKQKIKNYDFKKGLDQEFEIIDLSTAHSNHPKILTTPHRAGFYHIFWFTNGNFTHLVDFKPIDIVPNTLLFLNKDTVQRFSETGSFEGKAILFTDNFFCKTEADAKFLRSTYLFSDLLPVFKLQITGNDSPFAVLFRQMEQELLMNNDQQHGDILQNYLHNLMLLAERENKAKAILEIKKGIDLDYLLAFKTKLELKYKQEKTVSYFAEHLGITEKRLNQATSKILGKSPKGMIDERVMLEAKRLLAHTNDSFKQIGFELGFDEPTNFIKYFRKHALITPVEFRDKNHL